MVRYLAASILLAAQLCWASFVPGALIASVTLTDAQLKDLAANPVLLVAPPAGYFVRVQMCSGYHTPWVLAYVQGLSSPLNFTYGVSSNSACATSGNNFMTSFASSTLLWVSYPVGQTSDTSAASPAQGVYLSLTNGLASDYTGGDAGNTAVFKVWYTLERLN